MPRTRLAQALLAGVATLFLSGSTLAVAADADHPIVVIDTTYGSITVELDRTKAPLSVDNFLKYVDKGYYDGLVFHRVMSDFMIQTGGMTESNGRLAEKAPLFPPVKNESGQALSNKRGTIAMARTSKVDSATSQFFINLFDKNTFLDTLGGGYTAFGTVTNGMDVADKIAQVPVTTKVDSRGEPNENVPVKIVMIKSVKRKD